MQPDCQHDKDFADAAGNRQQAHAENGSQDDLHNGLMISRSHAASPSAWVDGESVGVDDTPPAKRRK